MSLNDRVQKLRGKLRALRRRRVEVHLPNNLMDAADTSARHHECYRRDIVTYALRII